MPAVIFLTGAPKEDELDWGEDGLIIKFNIPTRRLRVLSHSIDDSTPPWEPPKWRAISLMEKQEQELQCDGEKKDPPFYNYSHEDRTMEDFLQHSFNLIQTLEPERLTQQTASFWASFNTDETRSTVASLQSPTESNTENTGRSAEILAAFEAIDLKAVKSARYLDSIYPQTVTVNLLVGMISISRPKTVRLRRTPGKEMQIVELIVGDETRAGFGINIWLPVRQEQERVDAEERHLYWMLDELKRGDVVAFRNVALSTFRGTVYGQSLNRRFSKNSTEIIKIQDRFGNASVIDNNHSLAVKVPKVRRWVRDFVGEPERKSTEAEGKRIDHGYYGLADDQLPPDSP